MTKAVVKSLFIYPLKSAKGISVDQVQVEESGPRFDREWMLVKKESKSFISQRTHPQMSQLHCQLTSDHLVVQSAEQNSVAIPLASEIGEGLQVSLFNNPVNAVEVGRQFDEWFSDFLKIPVMLVRIPENNTRTTSGRNGPKTSIRFPDGYPFLMTNEATLAELNRRLPAPVSMQRFRPNIVIEGAEADAEDQWTSFDIDGISFLSVKACSRCAIIDVDPLSGKKSSMVSSELKKYRRLDGEILFGRNLSHTNSGTLKLGSVLKNIQLR